jgi:hypothetical protein
MYKVSWFEARTCILSLHKKLTEKDLEPVRDCINFSRTTIDNQIKNSWDHNNEASDRYILDNLLVPLIKHSNNRRPTRYNSPAPVPNFDLVLWSLFNGTGIPERVAAEGLASFEELFRVRAVILVESDSVMRGLRDALNIDLWLPPEDLAEPVEIWRYDTIAEATANQHQVIGRYPDAVHLDFRAPTCKDDTAANPHAKGLHGQKSCVTFEAHAFSAAMTAQIGSYRYLMFMEFTLLVSQQSQQTWQALFGDSFTDDAAALGAPRRERTITTYPAIPPIDRPYYLKMVFPPTLIWPTPTAQEVFHQLPRATQERQMKDGKVYPAPMRTWLVKEGVFRFFGGRTTKNGRQVDWDSSTVYERWSVTSYMVYDTELGVERFFPRATMLSAFGLGGEEIQRLLDYRPCEDEVNCGITSRPCPNCTDLFACLGQAWNKESMVIQFERFLSLWSSCEVNGLRQLSGFSSPVHVCGTACPYMQC